MTKKIIILILKMYLMMIGSWSLRLNSNNNNKRQAILFCF